MQIVEKKITELKEYKNNPRNNDDAVEAVAESIEQFGFKVPIIIDREGIIVAGHTRRKAAVKLGLDTVPCIIADDLTPEQIQAFRLADNKTAELAEWDFEALEKELAELTAFDVDMSLFGFDEAILDEMFSPPQEIEEDEIPEIDNETEPTVKYGDIWQLGRHRLMCGDSTDKASIKKLMNGKKADMVFTDPPYNINYSGVSDKRQIMNDKMSDEDFIKFLEKGIPLTDTSYVCCSWQYAHLFKKAMENIGTPPKAMIVWDKVNPAQHLDKYFKRHEIIWYYGKFGGEKTLRGDIWECKRQRNTVHPTMKPIELIAMALQDNPNGKIVYDGFGGSGSTLIACEQLNRICYMCELDPKYCDVIIARWEALTGEKAVKL